MKYFSMFSGIGGFEYGIQRAFNKQSTQIKQNGQRGNRNANKMEHNVLPTSRTTPLCVGYSEIDKYAIKVYERHFGGHKNYGDATTINPTELPDFDLLVGGFPCQAFSIAGKRKGFDDTRGTLFFDIARILSEKRPRHLVLENVKGLLSHDTGKTFQTILGVLSDLGYRVEWQVLNSKDFGVPQNRERVFIVGHLRDECTGQVFPITGVRGQATTIQQTDERQRQRVQDDSTIKEWHESYAQNRGGWQRRHRIRRLTPKECERLQGFPDNWTAIGVERLEVAHEPIDLSPTYISDTQRYKMCGNAVTTNVITAVMERLL